MTLILYLNNNLLIKNHKQLNSILQIFTLLWLKVGVVLIINPK
jgi:hypothetical protein